MDSFEIMNCLESMTILVDTREQPSERAKKRYESFGCEYRRQKLNYGDYTYNLILPDGSERFDIEESVNPEVMIERKMDLNELSACFCQERERFKREFERAKQNGASIYLLIEDGSWEHLIAGKYKTRFNKAAFFASLTAWMVRYRINVIFCKKETSGKIIKEILYRELKERLERGDYDWLQKKDG